MSVTTEQLLASAKEAADLTNVADYVGDPTWLGWMNDALKELHRFVTNKFKATYFRQYDFTLSAGQSQIALPSNFWRLKGLDLDADTPRRRTIRPYNFAERNGIRNGHLRDLDPLLYAPDRFYNLIGSSLLKIQAQEQAAGNYRLYYVPKPKPLLLPSTRAITVFNGDSVVANADANGDARWTLAAFNLDVFNCFGDQLTLSGAATPPFNNGTWTILQALSVTQALLSSAAGVGNQTFTGAGETATYASFLDAELEPYSEYIWLTAARKSLIKEESYQQAKALADQIALIRDDLTEALETDQGGPKTIIDTDEWGNDW